MPVFHYEKELRVVEVAKIFIRGSTRDRLTSECLSSSESGEKLKPGLTQARVSV